MLIKLQNPQLPPHSLTNRYYVYDLTFEDRCKLRELKFKFCDHERKWYTDDYLKVFQVEALNDPQKQNYLNQKIIDIKRDKPNPAFWSNITKFSENHNRLKPYQKAGVEQILEYKKCILGDEPGSGKTYQSISAMLIANSVEPKRAVIVCTATIKDQWLQEINNYIPDFFKIIIVNNTKHNFIKEMKEDDNKHQIVIVNYDLLSLNLNRLIKDQLLEFDPHILICDEAHYLKNMLSKRFISIKHGLLPHWKKIELVMMVTGSPMPNRPKDLYALIRLTKPEILGPYKDFRKFAYQYCAGRQGKWGFEANGSSNEDELKQRLALGNVLIRRLKEDILPQLPEKTMQLIVIEPNSKSTKILEKYEYLYDFEDIMERPNYWQKDAQLATSRKELALAKLDQSIQIVIDRLEEVDKLVVFAWHREVIEALQKALEKYKPAVITGLTKQELRQGQVDKFQKDPECKVFIGNIIAAGVGITLTASSNIEFVESSWVPEEILQAIDRCHRFGQKNAVNARFHVVENSIDQNVLDSVIKKYKKIRKILD